MPVNLTKPALSTNPAEPDVWGAVLNANATAIEAAVAGLDAAVASKLDAAQKGAANGVAALDATGKVPAAQLPAASGTSVADGSITTAKLADDAVTEPKLAPAVRTKLNAVAGTAPGVFRLTDYGAVPNDPAQDCGSAWDQAIAAIVAAGGGVLDLGRDTYYVNRALQTGANGERTQLPLPFRAKTASKVIIEVRGQQPGSISYYNEGGAAPAQPQLGMIVSTLTGQTYSSTLKTPSVIGSTAWDPAKPSSSLVFSNIFVRFTNCTIRTPNNPSLTAVDLSGVAQCELRGVMVDTPQSFGGTVALQTNPHAMGVITPGMNNNAIVRLERVGICGYYGALAFHEHTDADDLLILNSRVGLVPFGVQGAAHSARFGIICHENTQYAMAGVDPATGVLASAPGVLPIVIDLWDFEDANSSGPYAAFQTVQHVRDAGGKLRGRIKYARTLGGVGVVNGLILSGGANLYYDDLNAAPAAGAAATAPAQVTGLTATPSNGQVALAWSVPSNGGSAITDYVVQRRSPAGSGTFTTINDGVSTTPSYTDTGLTNGTSYEYQVAAVNAIGTGTFSAPASATPVNTLASDDFNRADSTTGLGTAPTGGAWSAGNGVLGITSQQASRVSLGTDNIPSASSVLNTGTANVTASAVLTLAATTAASIGVVVAHVDANNYIFARVFRGPDASSGDVALFKVQGNVLTQLALAATARPVALGGSSTMSVAKGATSVTVAWGGSQVISHTLSADDQTTFGSATRQGLIFISGDNGSLADNFTVS